MTDRATEPRPPKVNFARVIFVTLVGYGGYLLAQSLRLPLPWLAWALGGIVVGVLAGFAQIYPGITVSLREGDQEEMISATLAGRIELALAYSLTVPEEIESEPLIDLPPFAIVAANHPLARRKSVRLAELADEPFILLDLPHSRDYFFGLFRSAGIEPRIVFKSRSQELIRGLVALAESDIHLPVNIGNPDEYTLLQLAETVVEVSGSRSEIVFEALPVDDPKVRQPDISKARELLGWEPKVSLRDGLKRTIDEAGVERLVGASG